MIPWFISQSFSLGPVTLRTWGTFVAFGFLLGVWVAAKRAKRTGLDERTVWDLAIWMFVAAFVGARLFHVLAYDLGHYLANPLEIIDPRQPGFAITGGLLLCAAVFAWYLRRKKLPFLPYADLGAWGLPWGYALGRIGCFLIHDHPGVPSTFFLAVRYPDGISRLDLGLMLALVGLVTGLLFLFLDRKPRQPGFFLACFLMIEGVTRLWLDAYRLADTRMLSLTPAQWIALPVIFFGLWLMMHVTRKKGHM